MGKEDIKLLLFPDDRSSILKIPESIKKFKLINSFSNVAFYKIKKETSFTFFYTTDKVSERESKLSHAQQHQKL